MTLFCSFRVYYLEKQAMKKVKIPYNEASKGCISIHKNKLLGTNEIISEIFHLLYWDLFLGTNASNQHAGQQPGSLMGPSCCFRNLLNILTFFLIKMPPDFILLVFVSSKYG